MERMPTRVSARIAAIAESATLAVDAKAKALKAAGRPVIGFGAASPTSPPPATSSRPPSGPAPSRGSTSTPPPPACPSCAQAIADKTARDSGYQVEASQVLVTNGGKQAVYQTFATLLDPGDEVICPPRTGPPTRRRSRWPAASRPVPTDEGTGYLATVDDLEAARTDRTKVAAVRLAVQPDRRGLPAGPGQGDRRVGRRPRPVGRHRRDLRAPGLRRRGVLLDPGGDPARSPTPAWCSTAWPRPTR